MESIVQDDYSDPWVKRFGSRVAAISSLPANPLFSGNKIFEGYLSYDQRLRLSLARAKATMGAYALNIHDVAAQTQSFLNLHFDPAMSLDTGARTLVTAQTLAASTLVKYVKDHPAVKLLIDDILAFNLIAQYCLSEVSQGLDTINIETTATALPGGGFELHTPHPGAAKLTLPTNSCGIPAVGIVCARLIIKGRDSGVRPFVVPFNDGKAMTPGITAKLLPPGVNAPPVNHSMTSFNRVKLPPDALLTPLDRAPRLDQWSEIVGTEYPQLPIRSEDYGDVLRDYHRAPFRSSGGGYAFSAKL